MITPTHASKRRIILALLCTLPFAPFTRAQTKSDAQPAARPASEEKVSVENSSKQSGGLDDKLVLSPFIVTTEKDQGYYAENTLAGSRLNSNLADLAASITVVTKQQLDDTASFDINDVFRYEANTEGSSTYTPQILNRNFVKDSIAGYSEGAGDSQTNATSNRVRGLGVPTNSLNYYQTNARIPFDSYNTQSIEISRGPNSLLFGLGSPAGIVNQTAAQAALNKNTNTVTASLGSYGSYRSSLALNRSLIKDKLAVYGALLYEDKQFARKPSYDKTRRQYAAFTAQPFKNTQIRGSVENYDNHNRRPNFLSPRDYVTPWLQAGRPAWDPVTRTIKIMDTGVMRPGVYVLANSSPVYTAGYNTGDAALQTSVLGTSTTPNPQYTPAIIFSDNSRPLWRIDNGHQVDFFQKSPGGVIPSFVAPPAAAPAADPTAAQISANPAWRAINERRWTTSSGPAAPTFIDNGVTYTFGSGTYNAPGITNQSIYNWEKTNINQANFGEANGQTYNLELEQRLTENLFFSAGWLRQDFGAIDNYTISQQQGATVMVDTNLTNINGQPNPYFGLPYMEDFQPDTSVNDEVADNYRAILAYKLDFTRSSSGLVKWFGRHQLMGMWSKQDVDRANQRQRLVYTSGDSEGARRYLPNPLDNTTSGPTGYNFLGAGIRRNYYLASPGDPQATVTHGSGEWGNAGYGGPTNTQIEVYDYAAGAFKKVNVGVETLPFNNGTVRNQRTLDSLNAGLQSFFLNDRIVATFGWRRDNYKSRSTTDGVIFRQDLSTGNASRDLDLAGKVVAAGLGVPVAPALTNPQKFVNGYYLEDQHFNRWQRWDELSGVTSTQGVVVRPFKGWKFIEGPAERGSWLAKTISSISLTYNQSDNFNPPSAAAVDVFGRQLAKPTGDGKDYGIRFDMFDNKLVASLNFFENTSLNERTGAAGLILSRLTSNLDTNIFRAWATTVVRIKSGEDPTAETGFGSQPLTAAQEAQVGQLWGQPYNYYADLPAAIGATQDNQAKGYEFQMTYNPTRNWTMKGTFANQESIYNNVGQQYDAWLAVRLPVMMAATTDIPSYTTFTGRVVNLAPFWTGNNFQSDVNTSPTNPNASPRNYYQTLVDAQVSLAKAQQGVAAANQRKYRASFLTNYNFSEGKLKGFAIGGAARWESKAALGYYGRATDPTQPTVLTASDPSRPIFDKGNEFFDLWFSYRHKVFQDRVMMKIQLNVTNILENGKLQPIAVNYDGSVYGYRIVDPREFRVTTTFEF